MNVFAITKGPFPQGGAAVNRMINYLKGLVELQCSVNVLCIKPTEKENSKLNPHVNGTFEGINYQYTSGSTLQGKGLIKRIQLNLAGFFTALSVLRKANNENKMDILFMGVSNFIFTFIFYLFCKVHGIKFVQERSEYPFITEKNSVLFRLNLFVYLHFTCKLFDGFIIITDALQSYFKKYLKQNAKIFKLAILVEPEQFDLKIKKETNQEEYIAYCGSMAGNKDGITILLEAFHLIADKFPKKKLMLIGSTEFNGFRELQKKAQTLGIVDKIIFTGYIRGSELPPLLAEAEVLCLSRPTSLQAVGGFPTKLGEYLATGNPVVVTKVGEISNYLKDGKNAYLSDPDDAQRFAEKLIEAISNPEYARKIGLEGQKLAFSEFNYKLQSEKLYKFLKEL